MFRLHVGGSTGARGVRRNLPRAATVGSLPSIRRLRYRPGPAQTLMERRIFIAVFLSFVVVYAFQALFVAPEAPTPTPQQVQRPVEPGAPAEERRVPAEPVSGARALVTEAG